MTEIFHVNVDSARLAGESIGEGEAILFLHAGVGDRRMWHPQMAELVKSNRAIAYDRRGFGETTTEDEPFSHVEDLCAVLDQLGIECVTLVGCSQGGRIAVDFALLYPQRVNKLVLITPAISGAPTSETLLPEIEACLIALDEAEETDDLDLINKVEAHLWLDGPLSPEGRVGGSLRELFLDMNGVALGIPDLDQKIEPASAYERVSALAMPTLVIWGNLDFPHIQERCRYLVDHIPNAQSEEVADCAHMVNLEKAELVNRLLQNFLGD